MARLRHAVEGVCYAARVVRLARLVSGVALIAGLIAACSGSDPERATISESSEGGAAGVGGAGGAGGDSGSAGAGGGITLDAGDFFDANCGFQAINARREPAHIHLVVDRSGSMADLVGSLSKYNTTTSALVNLIEKTGWRSEFALTLFPSKSGSACATGSEVLSMQPGDTKELFDQGIQGPIAKKFAQGLAVVPKGGTPTGKTMAALVPKLKNAGPNTFVLLATDGGPNCNESVTCGAGECIPNIEQQPGCQAPVNCCDPTADPQFTNTNCLDSDTPLAAVATLAQMGVKTIVVGIPGSAEYATLLNLLAVAGGAPREGDTRYYRVDDLSTLEELLLKIGSEVTVSCDISLDSPPQDQSQVNVFFDKSLVLFDEANGWQWLGPTTIGLRGKACDDLLSGAVNTVQVVVGCPTEIVK